jgi:hypothetical protein
MTKPTIKIVNTQTGEEIEREMNAEELAQFKAEEAAELERQNVQIQKATDKAAAQAKLSALGLTADDLKALGL